jgi:hypothetical protein
LDKADSADVGLFVPLDDGDGVETDGDASGAVEFESTVGMGGSGICRWIGEAVAADFNGAATGLEGAATGLEGAATGLEGAVTCLVGGLTALRGAATGASLDFVGAATGAVALAAGAATGLFAGAGLDTEAGAAAALGAEAGALGAIPAGVLGAPITFSQPQARRRSALSKRGHDASGTSKFTSAADRIVEHDASGIPTKAGNGMITSGFVMVDTPPSPQR